MSDFCALVVDDDRSIRALLAAAFRRYGITTEEAEDGEIAISKLQTHSYDVIVLDLMMPKVNGVEVLAFMTENGLATPVIVISAASEKFLNTVDDNRVLEIIRKPFNLHDVTAKVLLLCGHPDATIGEPSR